MEDSGSEGEESKRIGTYMSVCSEIISRSSNASVEFCPSTSRVFLRAAPTSGVFLTQPLKSANGESATRYPHAVASRNEVERARALAVC